MPAQVVRACGDDARLLAEGLHRQGRAWVGNDVRRVEVHAPGGEQRSEIGGAGAPRFAAEGILRDGVLCVWIDEGQHAAAAQSELVDGVQAVLREARRMHQHQQVHVGIHGGEARFEATEFEQFAQLLVDDPTR